MVHNGGITSRGFEEIWCWRDVTIYWSNDTAIAAVWMFWQEWEQKSEGQEHSKKPGLSSGRGFERTFWQVISQAHSSYN